MFAGNIFGVRTYYPFVQASGKGGRLWDSLLVVEDVLTDLVGEALFVGDASALERGLLEPVDAVDFGRAVLDGLSLVLGAAEGVPRRLIGTPLLVQVGFVQRLLIMMIHNRIDISHLIKLL